MVAGVVLITQSTVDPGQQAAQARAGGAVGAIDAGEALNALGGESDRQILMVAGHDVDREATGIPQLRPCLGGAARAEQNTRGGSRETEVTELAAMPTGGAGVCAGDDGDARGQVPQYRAGTPGGVHELGHPP